MAVSGTISATTFETRKVIDHAFRYCKLTPQQIGAEQIEVAQDQLWMLLSSFANRGIQMWCIERKVLPLYEGTNEISGLTGTVDILNANLRSLTRLTGAYASTAGGNVENAFDGDLSTTLVQTSTGGSVVVDFGSAAAPTTVGYLNGNSSQVRLEFARSDDGTTWEVINTTTAVSLGAEQWLWTDLSTFTSARYFRVHMLNFTMRAREIFIGNNPRAVPMARMNRDDYTALVDRTYRGRPLQYWFDRQRDEPVIHLWPAVSSTDRFSQMEIWRKRYIMDVGSLSQKLDIPQRWYEAVVLQLASRIASVLPEVPDDREAKLLGLADRALRSAEDEERDNSPIKWAPRIGVYTR
jgi:hypothetical protein